MADASIELQFGKKTYPDIQEGLNAVVAELRKSWEGSAKEAGAALKMYLEEVAQQLATRHGTAWPGGTTENSLSKRTGAGVASIIRSVNVKGSTWATLTGGIGGVGYLGIHEYGGTISSKGKLLTIPLPAAMNSRGVAPPFARQWRNTFTARSKKGNLLIFQKRGSQIVPLYVLVDKVTIKPRLGMRRELEDNIPYFLDQATDRIANEVMRQIGD